MQVQIQALLVTMGGGTIGGPNTRSDIEVAKPPVFNREVGKVEGFIIACRLYLRMKIKETTIEEKVQWVLSYI